MSLVTYEPWSLVNRLHRDLDNLMAGRLPADSESSSAVADWVPAVDISEEEDRFVLTADVPGVDPKDIEVSMENGVLTLSGKREFADRDEKNGYRRIERVSGTFFRRFTLPETADAEGITARSSHGVLEISIPKQPKVMPRRIDVSVE
ncbi:MAG: Hsp20/alpha crystallin family protein [Gammaproteobacteria bacterium]|jgi:HSP20 family protein